MTKLAFPIAQSFIDLVVEKKKFVINSGRVKLEKHSVEVVKGSGGETITISVASTTEHEATLSGIV